MAQYEHQRSVQDGHGVLDAAQHLCTDCVPGGADNEEVTETLIEDDLGGQPRVRTAEDHCEGILACGELGTMLRILVGMDARAGDEAEIARAQLGKGFGGRHGASLRGSVETMTTDLHDEVRVEPCAKRIRAYIGGRAIVDTVGAKYVWEQSNYPAFYVPLKDVAEG